MSKAFVKDRDDDDDDDEDDEVKPPAGAREPGRPRERITPAGQRALQKERDHLWTVERPHMTNEVAAAAAQGDRSENAEYLYGKKRLREIDRRIRFLDRRLAAVQVVQPRPDAEGRIAFGSWFTILDEDGNESSYCIVGTDEVDTRARRISEKSPLAQAVLGKRVGDVATVRRPAGELEIEVLKVWFEP